MRLAAAPSRGAPALPRAADAELATPQRSPQTPGRAWRRPHPALKRKTPRTSRAGRSLEPSGEAGSAAGAEHDRVDDGDDTALGLRERQAVERPNDAGNHAVIGQIRTAVTHVG